MHSAWLIIIKCTLCSTSFALIISRNDCGLFFNILRTFICWVVFISVIVTFIMALIGDANSTNRERTVDNGTSIASAIACSKIDFRPVKEFSLAPWIVNLIQIARGSEFPGPAKIQICYKQFILRCNDVVIVLILIY